MAQVTLPCCICKAQKASLKRLCRAQPHAHGQAMFPATICNFNTCRAQKTSLWGWALGSVCTVVTESYEVVTLSNIQKKDESEEAWTARRLKAQAEINNRLVVLTHALVQVGPHGLAGEAARQQWHRLKAGASECGCCCCCCCPGAGRCGGCGGGGVERRTPLCSWGSLGC